MTGLKAAGKKIGPNDRCHCGSGKKVKKCCQSITPVQAPGRLLPGSVEDLAAAAADAAKANEVTKAAHFYTMAIDKLAKDLSKDEAGFIEDAAVSSLDAGTRSELALLLAQRSAVYLSQGDIAAAEEDAATSTRMDAALAEGHCALLAVFEKAGAPLHGQLQVVERGLESCTCEQLVKAKWRLKKAMSLQPDANTEEASDPAARSAAMLGKALAEPGATQDLHRAEQLLRLAAEAGDMEARRRAGVVLLELGRPVEAAEELAKAAAAGDAEAAELLRRLDSEAQQQQAASQAKLQALAAAGDLRAKAMLEELGL